MLLRSCCETDYAINDWRSAIATACVRVPASSFAIACRTCVPRHGGGRDRAGARADLVAAHPVGEQAQHFALAVGQRTKPTRLGIADARRDLRVEKRGAAGNDLHRALKVRQRSALADESSRPGLDRRSGQSRVGPFRIDDDSRRASFGGQRAGDLDPVQVRHLSVDHRNVWSQLADPGERLETVHGLTDDLDLPALREEVGNRLDDRRVIVRDDAAGDAVLGRSLGGALYHRNRLIGTPAGATITRSGDDFPRKSLVRVMFAACILPHNGGY